MSAGAPSLDQADLPTRAKPTLTELGRLVQKITSMGLRVGLPGRVMSYVPATQLAEVQVEILTVRLDETTGLEVPRPPILLSNVPVVFPSNGAGAYLSLPIVPGTTTGELRFMDRAIGRWLTLGAPTEPATTGLHKLEDAAFYPGLHALTAPLAPTDATGAVLEGTLVKCGAGATEPMIKATVFITLMDAMIAAALLAALPNDGGTAAFTAFQTAWNGAKATINATKGRVF